MLYYIQSLTVPPTPNKMNRKAENQLNFILCKIRKASNFGVINHEVRPKKKGPNAKKMFIPERGPLDRTDFDCVKNCFDEAFGAEMDQRFGNVDVIKGICHLMMCANEKRANQFAIALTNSLMETHHPVRVAERLEKGIRRFQQTTEPQLNASGVEALIKKLNERIERLYSAAA